MKRLIIIIIILTFLLLLLWGGRNQPLNSHWNEQNGKLKVLNTTAMIDDIVKQVGDGYVDTLTLIKGDLDPHSYQLVKGDDEKFSAADLIFYNGLGLEHGPSLQQHLMTSNKAIGLGNLIRKEEPAAIIYLNGQMDPHIWLDVSLWKKIIPFIVQALSQKDPAHAKEFVENGKKVMEEMLKAHHEAREILQSIPKEKRYLVTSHDAFNYFTRAYLAADDEKSMEQWSSRFAAPEGLSPESQLSSTNIREIMEHVLKYNILVLFPESNVSRDSIMKIIEVAKSHGVDLIIADPSLYADAMGEPASDGDTYLKMIKHNVKTIAEYLDGINTKSRY